MTNNKCKLCGELMLEGEEMFEYHGYSCPCPKPPMPHQKNPVESWETRIREDLAKFPLPLNNFTEALITRIKEILATQREALLAEMLEEIGEDELIDIKNMSNDTLIYSTSINQERQRIRSLLLAKKEEK